MFTCLRIKRYFYWHANNYMYMTIKVINVEEMLRYYLQLGVERMKSAGAIFLSSSFKRIYFSPGKLIEAAETDLAPKNQWRSSEMFKIMLYLWFRWQWWDVTSITRPHPDEGIILFEFLIWYQDQYQRRFHEIFYRGFEGAYHLVWISRSMIQPMRSSYDLLRLLITGERLLAAVIGAVGSSSRSWLSVVLMITKQTHDRFSGFLLYG